MIKRIRREAEPLLRWLFSALASIIGMGQTPSSIGLMRATSILPRPAGRGRIAIFGGKSDTHDDGPHPGLSRLSPCQSRFEDSVVSFFVRRGEAQARCGDKYE
jgi:hypothetical protein